MRSILDDYLLELILMDSLVFTSSRCIPDAERIIQSFVPPNFYDRIIAHYDALSDDAEDDGTILPMRWQRRAMRKDSAWKRMMVGRFVQIFCQAGCAGCQGLAEVAAFANGIGAAQECRQVFACLAQQKPDFSEKPDFCCF